MLLEVRGDWMFFASVFQFPSWSSHAICWRCPATNGGVYSYRNCRTDAKWRSERFGLHAFVHRLLAQGLQLSPLFTLPLFDITCFVVDWLHAVDLGIGQDIVGNVFFDSLLHMPGTTHVDKVSALFARIKEFYSISSPHSKLDRLTKDMIKRDGQPPKLRRKLLSADVCVPLLLL